MIPVTRWLALLFAAVLAGPALTAATDPADDLLKLVPPDTAICVVVRDLRGTSARLAGSPFARWLERSKLLDPFAASADRQKLADVETFLADKLGSTPQQLLDDVLGDAVVLAYRPGPPGKPADESGVILLHARDPARLATTLDKVNALQVESGELKAVADRSHAGGKLFTRTKADGVTEFVYRAGPLLVFSAQEAVLNQVVEGKGGSPAAASLRRLGAADATLAVWFHPARLAAELHAKRDAAGTPAAEKAVLTRIAEVWAACDGLAVSARADRGLEVNAALSADPTKLPAAVRSLLFAPAGPTAWGAVPADALAAAGGRLDLPALVAAVDTFATNKDLTTLLAETVAPLVGKSNLQTVLAGIGPEWVAWAEAPTAGVWPDWTLAVRLSPAATKPVTLALDFAAGLARLAYNRDHADQLDLGDDTRDGRTVKYLSGAIAQRPAFGVVGGFLVLASSPERVHGFRVGGEVSRPAVVRLDAARLRKYLGDQRNALAAVLAAQDGRPVAEVAKELDGLAILLSAFKRIELRHTAGDGLIRLTLDVETVEPLK